MFQFNSKPRSSLFAVIAITVLNANAKAIDVRINLADIVGGGNGVSGGTVGHGIDPSTGGTTPPAFFQISQTDNTNTYHSSSVSFVNGVFIPDGGAGAVTLDSSLHTFAGFPNTDANSWDMIKDGPNENSGSVLSGVNYASGAHSMIGLHANKGITFDLQQIAAANPNFFTGSFTAVAGISHVSGGFGTADWWVFVDGVLRQSQINTPGGVGTAVNLDLSPMDHFLTLVATDFGDGFSVDQIIFGDPIVHLYPPGDYNRNGTVDGADYVVWRNQVGYIVPACSGGDANCNTFVEVGEYAPWRANFGKTGSAAGSGYGESTAGVPEPTALLSILGIAPLAHLLTRRRRPAFALC